MNEQLKHALETAQQLPDAIQSAIAARILEDIEDYEEFGEDELFKERESDTIVGQPRRPLTEQEFMEQLYREGAILNIPTWEPLTEEEEAERARLARVFAGGKPLSQIVIEDRGPY
jgi:hypothetical protein